jgi:hypothetical protein
MEYAAYEIQGTGIKIGWDVAAVGDQLESLCAYFGLVTALRESAEYPITLTWNTLGHPVTLPVQACLVAQHHGLEAWQAGSEFYLCDDRGLVWLDAAAGLGVGTFDAAASTPPIVRRDLFLYSLLWLLRAQGWYAAHAACLTTGNGGCLMVAESGSGKSTLALGLLQEGWHYLADDAILFRSHAEAVEVRPLRRDLYLEPEAAAQFPDTRGHWQACLLREDTKQRLDVQALYPAQVTDTCFPDLLLFPTIIDAPQSRLVPIGKAEALLGLIQQSALPAVDPQMAPDHLDILGRLVRQTRHFRLLAGQDLARDPRRIAQLLEVTQPAPCA